LETTKDFLQQHSIVEPAIEVKFKIHQNGEAFIDINWSDDFDETLVPQALGWLLFQINSGNLHESCTQALNVTCKEKDKPMINAGAITHWHVLDEQNEVEEDDTIVDPEQVFDMGRADQE
jgi:hypothetical protein